MDKGFEYNGESRFTILAVAPNPHRVIGSEFFGRGHSAVRSAAEDARVDAVNREWLFRQLRQSLVLLADDGDAALAGLPDGCCKPDELAMGFDHFRSAVVGNFAVDLPPELIAVLTSVDVAFDLIVGDGWFEEAVRSAPEWAAVRERARVALVFVGCV